MTKMLQRIFKTNSIDYNRTLTFEMFNKKPGFSKLRIFNIVLDNELAEFSHQTNEVALIRNNTLDYLNEDTTNNFYLDRFYINPCINLTTSKLNNEIKMLYKTLSCPYVHNNISIDVDDYIINGEIATGNRVYAKRKQSTSFNVVYVGLINTINDKIIELVNVYTNYYYVTPTTKELYDKLEYHGIELDSGSIVAKSGSLEYNTTTTKIKHTLNLIENAYSCSDFYINWTNAENSYCYNLSGVQSNVWELNMKLLSEKIQLIDVTKIVGEVEDDGTGISRRAVTITSDKYFGKKCMPEDIKICEENNLQFPTMYYNESTKSFSFWNNAQIYTMDAHHTFSFSGTNIGVSINGLITIVVYMNIVNKIITVEKIETRIDERYYPVSNTSFNVLISNKSKLELFEAGTYPVGITFDKTTQTTESAYYINGTPEVYRYEIPKETRTAVMYFQHKDDPELFGMLSIPTNILNNIYNTNKEHIPYSDYFTIHANLNKEHNLIVIDEIQLNQPHYMPTKYIYEEYTSHLINGSLNTEIKEIIADTPIKYPPVNITNRLIDDTIEKLVVNPYDDFIDKVIFEDIDILTEKTDEDGSTKLIFSKEVIPVVFDTSNSQTTSSIKSEEYYNIENATDYSKYIPSVGEIAYYKNISETTGKESIELFESKTHQIPTKFKQTDNLWHLLGINPLTINNIKTNYKYVSEYVTEQVITMDTSSLVDNINNNVVENMIMNNANMLTPLEGATSESWLGNPEGNIVKVDDTTFKIYKPLIDGSIILTQIMAVDENGKSSKSISNDNNWVTFSGECDCTKIVLFIYTKENDVFYTKFSDTGFKFTSEKIITTGYYDDILDYHDTNQNDIPDKFEKINYDVQFNDIVGLKLFDKLTNRIFVVNNRRFRTEHELCLLFTEDEHPEEIINNVSLFYTDFDLLKQDNCKIVNNKIVLNVNRTIDISDYTKLYITVDSRNHYPFKSNIKGLLIGEFVA